MKKSSPSSAGKSTGRLGNTRLVRWLTGQPDQAPERDRLTKAAGGISGGLQSLIKTLHLGKALEGSVFLHPVLFCLLAAAYLTSGQAGKAVAVLGLLAFFVACAGAWYGVLGRREEDSYRLFPDLGIGINGLLLVGFVMIYIMGW